MREFEHSMKKHALAVASHSDDLEISLGGTAARLVREGWDVDFLLITNLSRIKDISKRMEEAKEAANVLGTNFQVLDLQESNYRDIPRAELVSQLDEYFARKPYQQVFIPCNKDSHQDHLFCSQVMLSVCRKNTCDVMMTEPPIPSGITNDPIILNYFVDISNEMGLKMKALRCHKSQMEAYGSGWLSAIEARARFWGEKFKKNFVEAFQVVKIIV